MTTLARFDGMGPWLFAAAAVVMIAAVGYVVTGPAHTGSPVVAPLAETGLVAALTDDELEELLEVVTPTAGEDSYDSIMREYDGRAADRPDTSLADARRREHRDRRQELSSWRWSATDDPDAAAEVGTGRWGLGRDRRRRAEPGRLTAWPSRLYQGLSHT